MDAANHEKLLEYGILSADINYLSEIKHMDKVDIAFVSDESEVFVSGTVEAPETCFLLSIECKRIYRRQRMIEIRNLTKYYGDKLALSDITFDVRDKELLGLLGPNGAGNPL